MRRNVASIAVMFCVTGGLLALTDDFSSWKSIAAWGLCAVGWGLAIFNARPRKKIGD